MACRVLSTSRLVINLPGQAGEARRVHITREFAKALRIRQPCGGIEVQSLQSRICGCVSCLRELPDRQACMGATTSGRQSQPTMTHSWPRSAEKKYVRQRQDRRKRTERERDSQREREKERKKERKKERDIERERERERGKGGSVQAVYVWMYGCILKLSLCFHVAFRGSRVCNSLPSMWDERAYRWRGMRRTWGIFFWGGRQELKLPSCPCDKRAALALSHRRIYETMVAERWPCASIFEDDVPLAR